MKGETEDEKWARRDEEAQSILEERSLPARCREILKWRDTGLLDQHGELVKLAKTMPGNDEWQRLNLAEHQTEREAMQFVVDRLQ